MTKETLAQQLDGREYPFDLTKEETRLCELSRLVVVAGASDDLMEFYGFIRDERGAPGGAYIAAATGLLEDHNADDCECEFCGYKALISRARTVTATWCPTPDISWVIDSDIPHAKFTIMEDGERFCEGIVFNIDDAHILEVKS